MSRSSREGDPDRSRKPSNRMADANGDPTSGEGLSLIDEEGHRVARNLARVALGKASVGDLGDPRYGLGRDGVLTLELDQVSYRAVEKIIKR
jgi:hypothetical protein